MEKAIYKNKNINIKEFYNIILKIEKISGYREKDILNNCYKITEDQKTERHYILKFYGINDNFFKYDVNNNNIVG